MNYDDLLEDIESSNYSASTLKEIIKKLISERKHLEYEVKRHKKAGVQLKKLVDTLEAKMHDLLMKKRQPRSPRKNLPNKQETIDLLFGQLRLCLENANLIVDATHSTLKDFDLESENDLGARRIKAFEWDRIVNIRGEDRKKIKSEESGNCELILEKMAKIQRIDWIKLLSSQRTNIPVINGTAEQSTSRSLPNGVIGKTTRKRKHLLSNSSLHKPASKRRRKATVKEQNDKSNNQSLRNSVRRPKRKRTNQSKGEESTAAESQNEETMYAQPSVKYFRKQRRDSQEDSTADESQAGEMFPLTVAKSVQRQRRGSIEELTADESQDEEMFTPAIAKSLQKQRSGSFEELTADESQNDEPLFKPFSIKPVKRLRNGSQESTADESEDEKFELRKRTSGRRRKRQVESSSQNEIKNSVSRNSSISRRGRRRRRRSASVEDNTSQDETLLTELEDPQTEEESNVQNPRNLFRKSKRKQTLQNERDGIDNQEELSADYSQSELLGSPFSFKSIRMLRRSSQEDSTADESQNGELGIENSASIKRKKRHSQIESKKSINRNTGTSRRGKSRGNAVSASDTFQDETLISESKKNFDKLTVKCYDILIDPSFESDPVVKKFKKDNLINYDSPRDDEGSGKGETYEILDEVDGELGSSKNPDSEDENPDIEDINDSFKQASSAPCESDSVALKNTVSNYISTSRSESSIHRALSVDDSFQEETSLNQINASEKKDFHPTTDELLSDIDSEEDFDSTSIEQGDKPEKELNEDEADLDEEEVGETESNVDEAKGIDVDSKEEDENENESESGMVKENGGEQADEQRSAGNHSTSFPDKDALGRSILHTFVDPIFGRKGPATPPGIPPDSDEDSDD